MRAYNREDGMLVLESKSEREVKAMKAAVALHLLAGVDGGAKAVIVSAPARDVLSEALTDYLLSLDDPEG